MNLAQATDVAQAHAELAALAARYRALPPRRSRWKSNVGRQFLDDLEDLILDYDFPVHQVAAAFGTTPQAVSFMRWRGRNEFAQQWPDDCELTDLQRAWGSVRALNAVHQQVRRNHPAFAAVHAELWKLHRFYDLEAIASAAGIRPRHLQRFLEHPSG